MGGFGEFHRETEVFFLLWNVKYGKLLVFSMGMSNQPVIYLIKSIFVKRKACNGIQVPCLSHQCNVQMANGMA